MPRFQVILTHACDGNRDFDTFRSLAVSQKMQVIQGLC